MAAVIGGIIALILGVITLIFWVSQFLVVLAGSIPVILIIGGVIAIAAGIVTIKDKAAAEQIIEDNSLSDFDEEFEEEEGAKEEKATEEGEAKK